MHDKNGMHDKHSNTVSELYQSLFVTYLSYLTKNENAKTLPIYQQYPSQPTNIGGISSAPPAPSGYTNELSPSYFGSIGQNF